MAIVERFKQESMYGLSAKKSGCCGDVAVSGGLIAGSRGGTRGGGPPPPLFLDQNEARRAEKFFFEACPTPYLRVWMTAPPPLCEGLDPPLDCNRFVGERERAHASQINRGY